MVQLDSLWCTATEVVVSDGRGPRSVLLPSFQGFGLLRAYGLLRARFFQLVERVRPRGRVSSVRWYG